MSEHDLHKQKVCYRKSSRVKFISVFLEVLTITLYYSRQVRAVISDFAILIAIMIMVGVDLAFGVNTPKLDIPLKFQPTASEKRGWVVPPLGKNPVWTIPAAAIPALLATILVFMDQQITALIVNRREHKLKVNTSNAILSSGILWNIP